LRCVELNKKTGQPLFTAAPEFPLCQAITTIVAYFPDLIFRMLTPVRFRKVDKLTLRFFPVLGSCKMGFKPLRIRARLARLRAASALSARLRPGVLIKSPSHL
jgi:hypothetical protein